MFSQEFTIPKNVTLKSDSDYKKYENDVLQGINWLENTPINQQVAKRKKVSAFLLQWMTGTPSFSIKMQSFQMELTEKNPDLLISFLGGWAKYALENPADKDNELAANIAGFESLIKVYTSNKENVGGYMLIKANSIEEASVFAKECPIIKMGGSVEVRNILKIKK